MLLKIIGFIFLVVLTLTSLVEARQHKAERRATITQKKALKTNARNKKKAIASRKKPPRASRVKKHPSVRTSKQRRVRTPNTKQAKATSCKTKRSRGVAARKKTAPPMPPPPQQPLPINPPPTYLSLLNPHTQQMVKQTQLDLLYSKNLFGQNQVIALTEDFKDWNEIKNVIQNNQGDLLPEIRKNYSSNFLPCIGFCSEITNSVVRSQENTHGSEVASTLLDLAPKAKVLPASTFRSPQLDQSYSLDDLLFELVQRQDVGIINNSAGYKKTEIKANRKVNIDGTVKYEYKHIYPTKLLEAFKEVAKAGKVIVIAAGNKGESIENPVPEFLPDENSSFQHYVSFLLENLDSETQRSIIFAGALDSNTRLASGYSNKPGTMTAAQERFLFAPGDYHLSYKNQLVSGTSYAAPTISAAIANLCAKPGVHPQKAVRALLESADKDPDVRTYGRGRINAAKALEWLERNP